MGLAKKCSVGIMGLAVALSFVSCSSTQKPLSVANVPHEISTDVDHTRVPAADCDSSKFKMCKEARRNDTADRYMLAHDGTLFRRINNAQCAVTSKVTDFKISQHPNDVAVIYFVKEGNLYLVNLDKERRQNGQCPSAAGNTKQLMANVEKYTVTSNTETTIVNAALDRNGNFKAWDNVTVVYSDSGVEEYSMNECFGKKGKSFSSYVLFTRDRNDSVTKVKVSGSQFRKDESKTTHERYNRISEFKDQLNVCK